MQSIIKGCQNEIAVLQSFTLTIGGPFWSKRLYSDSK